MSLPSVSGAWHRTRTVAPPAAPDVAWRKSSGGDESSRFRHGSLCREEAAVQPVHVIHETIDGVARADARAAVLAEAVPQLRVARQLLQPVGQLLRRARIDEEAVLAVL